MIHLLTGSLDFEQLDREVLAIVDHLKAFGVETVYFSFGFACHGAALVKSEDLPVRVDDLARFIADSEADGIFELGESDLRIRGGGLEFLLCHERDIHCSGEKSAALLEVRRRWARDYEDSQERRSGGRWHRLAGRPKDPRSG